MITVQRKAGQLETARRSLQATDVTESASSDSDLSEQIAVLNYQAIAALNRQAAALTKLAERFAVAIESLAVASKLLLSENAPEVELGIDLVAEMRRYELLLIKRALRKAEGSQVKAAALLNLHTTTLNSKLKLYAGRNGKPSEAARSLFLS